LSWRLPTAICESEACLAAKEIRCEFGQTGDRERNDMGVRRQWQKQEDNLTVATLIVAVLVSAYIILEWLVDSWLEH
jgi:hypothetical protein